jgi:hypothetical protein
MHRLLLQKASKAIRRLNVIQEGHKVTIQRQQAELETLRAKRPQKRIVINPNIQFTNIED